MGESQSKRSLRERDRELSKNGKKRIFISAAEGLVRERFDRRIEDVYDLSGREIAEGGFGSLKEVRHKASGGKFAMKTIPLGSRVRSREDYAFLAKEVELLKCLDHPNVCRIHEVFWTEESLCIIMDYYSGGDLLDQEGFKGEEAAAAVIAKVLAALRYCHGHGIAHRDIKPENVMYSYPGAQAEIKLVDFGLSSRNLSVSQEVVGSWLFMAPETLRRQEHSPYLADMWGVGCLAFNLLAGYQPFRGATLGSVKAAIAAAQVRFDGKIWRLHSPEAKDFVASLLRKSPQERLTPGEALSHPWIARVLERTPPPSALDPFPRAGLKGEVISRLRSFRDTELFERIAWAAVARSLEPRMLHRLSRNFHKADAANQGVITEEDLRRVLRESDDVPAGDFEPMLASVRCKPVTFNEFVAALLDETQIDRRHLRLAFDRMDCDSDGAIDASDLQTILGSALSLEQAHEAIAFFNGSDRVTFPQFCSSLRRMQLSPISISPRPSLSFDTAASNGTGDRKEGQCDILSAAD